MEKHDTDAVDAASDTTDLGPSRLSSAEVVAPKVSCFTLLLRVIAMVTYISDMAADCFLAYKYYHSHETWLFILTALFTAVPSFIIQVLSLRWFGEDAQLSVMTIALHVLQLGPVIRFVILIYAATKVWRSAEMDEEAVEKYVMGLRDSTTLGLVEALLESAPQLTLQVYVLYQQGSFDLDESWPAVVNSVMAAVSLALALVSYYDVLHQTRNSVGLCYCGWLVQALYRLFVISSRVTALGLFASSYPTSLVGVLFAHWALMLLWLWGQGSGFCAGASQQENPATERLFSLVVALMYVFMFLNMQDGRNLHNFLLFYSLMFVENSCFAGLWLWFIKADQPLRITSCMLIWLGFLAGMALLVMYYKLCHPKQRNSRGGTYFLWLRRCCCLTAKSRHTVDGPVNPSSLGVEAMTKDSSALIFDQYVEFLTRSQVKSLLQEVTPTRPSYKPTTSPEGLAQILVTSL